MAALAMRPKLLNRISNEKYQEKDKWKIDDIALGPANELLISGHNLDIPTTFISMYKEDSGKYDNRPEFNRSFRQPQPGEQFVLFLEGSSIIGLKVESALRMVSIKDMSISKMLNWKRSPTCVCFYRGELYAASSSSNIVNVCNLDSEEKSDIVLSEMSDCVLDMVVAMEKIYVCTKVAGRALVFSVTGSKEMEFKNASESDAMAKSICIHKRTELVFVLWNNIQIQIYFQKTSQCLHAFDMTEDLHKICVTTKNILVTLSASQCIVSVYDVGEVIEIGEFEKKQLLSVEKTHRKKSMSHDEENLKDHPANNENLRRESGRDIQGLQERIKELDEEKGKVEKEIKTMRHEKKELEKENKATLRKKQQIRREMKAEKAKGEINKTVFPKVIASQEEENLKLQEKECLIERRSTRESEAISQLQEKIGDLEVMKNELISQQKTLKDNLEEENEKVEKEIKILRHEKEELEKENNAALCQKQQIRREMEAEKTKGEINKKTLTKVIARQAEENLILQEKTQYLIERLSTRESEAILQEMRPRLLSEAELDNVSCQKDTAINAEDGSDSEFAESVDTGIYSSISTSTSHFANLRVANGEQLNPDLKVAFTLTEKGAHMHIPDTGVELDIPTGAVQKGHKQLIELAIIPFDKHFAPIKNFSSNSSVVVELLPNKARFSLPVYLKLPHCLQLKRNYKDNKNPVKVFVSHHEEGPPVWKENSSAKCTLEEDHCVIRLKHFCWVKYEINDKLVVGKRLKVFTAGKSIHANDSIAEIEVGYYMDLPGRAENMIATLGMEFYQNKPFVFVKEGKLPLHLVHSKTVPNEWTYITPNDNPKIISYKSVADDKDTSCPFALEKSASSERKPYCIFKIVQGNESVELSMRF